MTQIHETANALKEQGERLDWAVLNEVFRGDQQKVDAMLRKFLTVTDGAIREIGADIDQRNTDNLAISSHRLKSSALMVGASMLADICNRLEDASIERDWQRITALWPLVAPEMEKVRMLIDAHVKKPD